MISEGNIGLMRAVAKYDHTRGFRFSTYAASWINQSVTRAIADHSRTIDVPVYIHDAVLKARKIMGRFSVLYARELTSDELSKVLVAQGLKVETARIATEIAQRPNNPASLDKEVSTQDGFPGSTLGERLAESLATEIDPEDNVFRQRLFEDLSNCGIARVQMKVLIFRYGFYDGVSHTVEAVAEALEMTVGQVRLIEKAALKKAQEGLSREYLTAITSSS